MSTPDDLAHLEARGISTSTTGWLRTNFRTRHYKYPQTVGNDTIADNINFNILFRSLNEKYFFMLKGNCGFSMWFFKNL